MFTNFKRSSKSKSKSNNFIQNKKLLASFFERQIIYHLRKYIFIKVTRKIIYKLTSTNSKNIYLENV